MPTGQNPVGKTLFKIQIPWLNCINHGISIGKDCGK